MLSLMTGELEGGADLLPWSLRFRESARELAYVRDGVGARVMQRSLRNLACSVVLITACTLVATKPGNRTRDSYIGAALSLLSVSLLLALWAADGPFTHVGAREPTRCG